MLFNVYKYYLLTRIYFGLRVFVSGSAYLFLAPRIFFRWHVFFNRASWRVLSWLDPASGFPEVWSTLATEALEPSTSSKSTTRPSPLSLAVMATDGGMSFSCACLTKLYSHVLGPYPRVWTSHKVPDRDSHTSLTSLERHMDWRCSTKTRRNGAKPSRLCSNTNNYAIHYLQYILVWCAIICMLNISGLHTVLTPFLSVSCHYAAANDEIANDYVSY